MNWGGLIQIEDVVRFLLIVFRMSGLFMVAPLLSNKAIPHLAKIGLVAVSAILLMPVTPFKPSPNVLASNVALLVLIFQELTIGLILGFVSFIMFSVISSAGEFFGMSIGYSIATIFDPANEDSAGVLTSLYVIVGGILFLYLDGHHVMLTALVRSFDLIPIGHSFNLQIGWAMTGLVAKVFIVSFQMAAPVLVVITTLNVIFGVITKVSPQMNIYMNTGFIISPILGMIVLMLTMPLFRVLFTHLTGTLGDDLVVTLRQLKGI